MDGGSRFTANGFPGSKDRVFYRLAAHQLFHTLNLLGNDMRKHENALKNLVLQAAVKMNMIGSMILEWKGRIEVT
ncbi:hypothetical protein GCM10010916_25500 [Paenibacillus abyssi]|uniref:Uncharacterized protein n=1 Tax=Paenibacillus abyssi TaxID=1340531 RepID=A0A917D2A6_9BACL|nr:hypothetical protein GCM10010916_25500 [Paenibacillus abyssi]